MLSRCAAPNTTPGIAEEPCVMHGQGQAGSGWNFEWTTGAYPSAPPTLLLVIVPENKGTRCVRMNTS